MTGKGRKMRRTILPAIAAGVMMLSALNQTEVTAKTLKDGEVKAEQVWQDSGQQVYTKEPRCGDRTKPLSASSVLASPLGQLRTLRLKEPPLELPSSRRKPS